MNDILLIATAAGFLVAGLLLGFRLRRGSEGAAVAAARQESDRQVIDLSAQLRAKDEALEVLKRGLSESSQALDSERKQVVALTGELAKAATVAGQLPGLRTALDEATKAADLAKAETSKAAVVAAEARTKLAELEASEGERRHALEASIAEAEGQRRAAKLGGEQLAKALADKEGLEKRLARESEEVNAQKAESSKVRQELDEARLMVAALQKSLAEVTVELGSARGRVDESTAEVGRLRQAAEALRVEVRGLSEDRAKLAADLDAERKAAEERRAEAERAQQQIRAHVEKVAGDLVQQKGEAIVLRNKEGLEALLKPLSEKLKDFEAKVDKTFDTDNRDRASLLKHLKDLQTTQEKLHKDAEALSNALARDSKQQGDWGELMLEKVLETAGLQAGRDFEVQASHTDEDGKQKRPDAIVYLPQERALVVDAKCSLTAFIEVARATDEATKEKALDAHVASLRAHVKNLASKDYTRVLKDRSLDIVLLFVPNEAALLAALSRAPALYEEAFKERVVLTSPTTLFAAMKLIEHVWRSEKQSQGAAKIASEAGKLLEKLSGFVEALDDVGQRLGQARDAYETARGRLATGKGNALGKARKILSLGAATSRDKVRNLLDGAVDDDEPEEEAPAQEQVAPEGG